MEIEKKYCFSCQTERGLEHFEEGLKSCNVCRNAKQKWTKNNPEKVKEQRERRKEKYKDKTFYCELCDVEKKLLCKTKHEKTQFHQAQLRRRENPDLPPLPEPDEIKVVDGKKNYIRKKCKVSMLYYNWESHIMERHQPEVENV